MTIWNEKKAANLPTSDHPAVAKLRAIRIALKNEGVEHLVLFGSQARGRASVRSDIDIAVEVTPGRKFSLLDLVGIEHIVSDATGIPANAFMRRSLDKQFQIEIAREGIPIF